MSSFGYPKHNLKTLEFAQQHFWTQSSILVKFILIQWLDEEDWIKSMYKKYITYDFLAAIGPHVYDSWNTTKQKKIEKIM
jgi:hypothetical protein